MIEQHGQDTHPMQNRQWYSLHSCVSLAKDYISSHQIRIDPNELAKTLCFYVLIDGFTFRFYLVHFVDRNFLSLKDAIVEKLSKFVKIHRSRYFSWTVNTVPMEILHVLSCCVNNSDKIEPKKS